MKPMIPTMLCSEVDRGPPPSRRPTHMSLSGADREQVPGPHASPPRARACGSGDRFRQHTAHRQPQFNPRNCSDAQMAPADGGAHHTRQTLVDWVTTRQGRRATSAGPTFFHPNIVGPSGKEFVDAWRNDVYFVHGLRGAPMKTWGEAGNSDLSWLENLLSRDAELKQSPEPLDNSRHWPSWSWAPRWDSGMTLPADADPDPLDYFLGLDEFETDLWHGDGAASGVTALCKAPPTPRSKAIASRVRSADVGHGEAASGITALINVLLMMKSSAIPPGIGLPAGSIINHTLPSDLSARNVHIAFRTTPFRRRDGKPRRIFVNNFSAAGGNTALLLEDAPMMAPATDTTYPNPLVPSDIRESFQWASSAGRLQVLADGGRQRKVARKTTSLCLFGLASHVHIDRSRILQPAAAATGRPPQWNESQSRKLARLWAYTTQSAREIAKVVAVGDCKPQPRFPRISRPVELMRSSYDLVVEGRGPGTDRSFEAPASRTLDLLRRRITGRNQFFIVDDAVNLNRHRAMLDSCYQTIAILRTSLVTGSVVEDPDRGGMLLQDSLHRSEPARYIDIPQKGYLAPEIDLLEEAQEDKVRHADVWTMGCIVSEVISWLLGECLETFKYYSTKKPIKSSTAPHYQQKHAHGLGGSSDGNVLKAVSHPLLNVDSFSVKRREAVPSKKRMAHGSSARFRKGHAPWARQNHYWYCYNCGPLPG